MKFHPIFGMVYFVSSLSLTKKQTGTVLVLALPPTGVDSATLAKLIEIYLSAASFLFLLSLGVGKKWPARGGDGIHASQRKRRPTKETLVHFSLTSAIAWQSKWMTLTPVKNQFQFWVVCKVFLSSFLTNFLLPANWQKFSRRGKSCGMQNNNPSTPLYSRTLPLFARCLKITEKSRSTLRQAKRKSVHLGCGQKLIENLKLAVVK